MKRRMKPRDPPPRPPMHPKDKLAISVRQRAAEDEMMYKTNQQLVDTIRNLGRKSGNMLMRVQMMEDNPIFATGKDLPSSLTSNSFAKSGYPETISKPTAKREDLVKGGSGEDVYLVSRGVVPSVIPAKYDSAKGKYIASLPTTMADSYPNHSEQRAKAIAAKNAGQAQAKDWAEAVERKKELEQELDAIDAELLHGEKDVKMSSTRHGLFGRTTNKAPFGMADDTDRRDGGVEGAPPLKGLSAARVTTMKNSFIEHPSRKRMVYKNQQVYGGMQYSLLAPPSDDPNASISPPKVKKTQTVGKFKDVLIPTDPSELRKMRGSEVVGSAFRWKGCRDQSKNAEEFSWPSDKLVKYDFDKEKVAEQHKYGSYDITKTRYGECAKECDYGKSVHVKSLKEIARHEELRMKE